MLLLLPLRNRIHNWLDRRHLRRLPATTCDVTNLRLTTSTWLRNVITGLRGSGGVAGGRERLGKFEITTSAGGVNAGDRRALYCLLRALRPSGCWKLARTSARRLLT